MLVVATLLLAACAASSATPAASTTTVPPASSVAASSASSSARCEVLVADGLRVRRGPGTDQEIVDTLPQGTLVTPLARAPSDQWLLVNVASRAQRGWVNTNPAFLTCNTNIAALPLDDPATASVAAVAPTPGTSGMPEGINAQLNSAVPPTPTVRAQSPFTRSDPRPEGIAEQLSFGTQFSSPACFFPLESMPLEGAGEAQIRTEEQIEILESLRLCFIDFAPNQPVAVQITRPDGSSLWQGDVTTDDVGTSAWQGTILPGEPLGAYTVTAIQHAPADAALPELLILTDTTYIVTTQHERRATATLEVVPAARRWLKVEPNSTPPGTTLQVYLAGYAPEQSVPVYLYRASESPLVWTYAAVLPPVQIDGRGEARFSLDIQPDDPPGRYAVHTNPAATGMVTVFTIWP
jgi:hypothetical protein